MAGRVLYALGVLLVFGALGVAMAASARRSWQKGDGVDHFFGLEEWWAVLLAFAVAILGPIIILVG